MAEVQGRGRRSKPEGIVKPITAKVALDFIRRKHPTGKGANAANWWSFGLFVNGELKGVSTWGYNLAGGATAKTLFGEASTKQDYVDNLRLFVEKNDAMQPSAFLSFCTKIIFKYNPRIKYLVAYADGVHGFLGKIYQAANYEYTGKINSTTFFLIPGYGLCTARTVYSVLGNTRLETILKYHPNAKMLHGYNFRYVRFRDKETREQLIKHARFPVGLPPPKEEDLKTIDHEGTIYKPEYLRKYSFMPYKNILQ